MGMGREETKGKLPSLDLKSDCLTMQLVCTFQFKTIQPIKQLCCNF
jgi:hypothetical protein